MLSSFLCSLQQRPFSALQLGLDAESTGIIGASKVGSIVRPAKTFSHYFLLPVQFKLIREISLSHTTAFTYLQEVLAAGGAAIAAGIAAVFSRRGGQESSSIDKKAAANEEPALPKIDVSIPYSAAAMLAFDEWKGDKTLPADAFADFEAIYEEKTVAMVTSKKVAREFEEATKQLEDTIKKADAKLVKLGEEQV